MAVNPIDVNIVDGVCFEKIQESDGQGIQEFDQ